MKTNSGLLLCLIFTATLSVLILAFSPYGGFPDEQSHYQYAEYMHYYHKLPPISFDISKILTAEGFQPPLYYMLGSLLISGNQPASVIRLRCLSLFFALLTIFITWKSGELVFGRDHPATLLATAVIATNAQFVFTFSGISNLTALVGTCALVFYFAIRGIQEATDVHKNAAWMGICYGLALLSRTISAFLVVVAVASIFLKAKDVRSALKACVYFALTAFAVAGWWYLRNWIYYEDPLLWKLHATTVGSDWVRSGPLNLFYMFQQCAFLHATFWAYFGKNEYHAGIFEYAIYLLFEVLAIIGFLELVFRKTSRVSISRPAIQLICLTVGLGVGEIVWLQTKLSIPQGRYFYISFVPIAMIFASGSLNLIPAKFDLKKAALFLIFFLAAMCLYLLGRYYFPHIV